MITLDNMNEVRKAFNLAPADAQEVTVASARNQEWLTNHLAQKAVQNAVVELIKRMRTVKDAEFKVKFTKEDDQITAVISGYSANALHGNKYIRLALEGGSTNAKFWDANFVMADLIKAYFNLADKSATCAGLSNVNDVISKLVNKAADAVVEINAAVKTKKVGK